MDELVSTARIGRSLGVHLILATQKPSGVVNDQIWSNSKFRVCLRVQDKSDSMDMIKVPDAASLKNPGRFYLQVGYNELFAMGQAAWAGAQYYPTEKRKKKVDQSISIVDDVGNIIKSLDTKSEEVVVQSKGEEITNIVKYIVEEARRAKVSIPQLWLDRIPDEIYVDKLKAKYEYKTKHNVINPIIGEYDDPDNQKQNVLTLPLSTDGNTIVFGSGGSGKELMLTSIIYSTITTHTPKEVNFYILDFGAETLTMFRNAPHVGEVILSTETEKITNLFKMITQTIEERKKLFADYNGSYDFYINHGGKQIPMLVVIINNVEAFTESYEDYEELLGQMTRDCLKYGVVFIFSTNGPNTVRYRIRQNFKQNVVLQFNDPSDYGSVIPGVRKKEPSKVYGRGLISLDGIYEFQTAFPYAEEKMIDYIRVICTKLNTIFNHHAKRIPVLPEVVNTEYLRDYLGDLSHIPVGVDKETLEIATMNLKEQSIFNITGEDITAEPEFLATLIAMISKTPNTNCIVMDSLSVLNEISNENVIYSNETCYDSIDALDAVLAKKEDGSDTTTTVCVIIGVNNLMQKLSSIEKGKFTGNIEKSNSLETVKYIIVDTIDAIKSINYEQWYKGAANMSSAVWIGNGISNQFTIKVTTNARLLRAELAPGFGYNIKKGKASVTKFVSEE
jgi:S-DNA-T family DNA segregation ATPase FtsK/SpoIIIE